RSVGDGETMMAPAWAWRIGDALVFAHPNEAYSLLQRSLRGSFPDRPVAVLNVTNGHIGYLPPAPHYDRDMYPVWQTPFAAGGLERLIEEGRKALGRLLG
ncbi:MAG: alkaline ceramidase, partial [Chloroflexi bacterium]|nr:alkaline ceramidase [Chloroflexota bacterium]